MSEDQGEKTEQATDTRREEYRNRGQVAHSKEIASAIFFLAAAGSIYIISRYASKHIVELLQYTFGLDMIQAIREGNPTEAVKMAGFKLAVILTPILAGAGFLGALSSIMQIKSLGK